MTTPQNTHPGTNGINFAESGARISVGPTPPATHPLSLTQQVGEFQSDVASGSVTFNSASTLFFLLGGLNDHKLLTTAQIQSATTQQVATLYSLGARYFEIADIPSLVPAFADSAATVNPAIAALIPQLQGRVPRRGHRPQQLGQGLRRHPRQSFEVRHHEHDGSVPERLRADRRPFARRRTRTSTTTTRIRRTRRIGSSARSYSPRRRRSPSRWPRACSASARSAC